MTWEIHVHTETCTKMILAVLFTNAKNWKQLRHPSIGEQMNKPLYVHTMEFYSMIKSGVNPGEDMKKS